MKRLVYFLFDYDNKGLLSLSRKYHGAITFQFYLLMRDFCRPSDSSFTDKGSHLAWKRDSQIPIQL